MIGLYYIYAVLTNLLILSPLRSRLNTKWYHQRLELIYVIWAQVSMRWLYLIINTFRFNFLAWWSIILLQMITFKVCCRLMTVLSVIWCSTTYLFWYLQFCTLSFFFQNSYTLVYLCTQKYDFTPSSTLINITIS